MPIQSGVYKVKGKMEGRSYYKPKYSANHLIRSINPQMSERVKTDPAFARTRSNAAEFGASANFAYEILETIGDYKNMINRPGSASDLTKTLLQLMAINDGRPVGRRSWLGVSWQDVLRARLRGYRKFNPSSLYNTAYGFIISKVTLGSVSQIMAGFNFKAASADDSALRLAGITQVDYIVKYALINAPYYDMHMQRYNTAYAVTVPLATISHIVGDDYPTFPVTQQELSAFGYLDNTNYVVVPIVEFIAYKKVGSDLVPQERYHTYDIIQPEGSPLFIEGVEIEGEFYPVNDISPELPEPLDAPVIVRIGNYQGQDLNNTTVFVNGLSVGEGEISGNTISFQTTVEVSASRLHLLKISTPSLELHATWESPINQ